MVAELRDMFVPILILVCLTIVDATIDLNDQLAGWTVEIEDEPANRVLPPKAEAT